MSTVYFTNGSEITASRVQEIVENEEFALRELDRQWDVDGLGHGHASTSAIFANRDGSKVGFYGTTYPYSDGVRGQIAITLGAVRCGDDDKTCRDEARNLPESERRGRTIPRNQHPNAFYAGDINGDGLIDFMSVLPDGAALVFYQQ